METFLINFINKFKMTAQNTFEFNNSIGILDCNIKGVHVDKLEIFEIRNSVNNDLKIFNKKIKKNSY